MSEREQAMQMLDNVPDYNLHIVLAVLRELTGGYYDDYVENALDEADYEADHTTERMTHHEVFDGIRGKLNGRLQT